MNPLDQSLAAAFPVRRGMMFAGFGGQPPRPSDAFGFGQQPQTGTPPFSPGPPMVDPMPAAPTKWAAGGAGWDALGGIGDTLMTLSGAPNLVAAAQQNQQQRQQMQQFGRAQAARQQEQQQGRQFDWQDWVAKQQYERANPAPVKNDTVNDYEFLRQKLGDEAANQYLRNFAAGPVMAVEGFDAAGNPTKTFVPRGTVGSPQPSAAPSGPAVGTVRNGYRFKGGNYRDPGAWEKVGGAPSQGGGTFR